MNRRKLFGVLFGASAALLFDPSKLLPTMITVEYLQELAEYAKNKKIPPFVDSKTGREFYVWTEKGFLNSKLEECYKIFI